jgi:hypothetical protein
MRGFTSAFPEGASGIGLVFLRISVLLGFYEVHDPAGDGMWMTLLWGVTLLLLAGGFLTPITVGACIVWNVMCFLASRHPDAAWLIGSVLSAAALGLLGPGAYSVDAKLFGRRRLFA